jgi:hypothetical protein
MGFQRQAVLKLLIYMIQQSQEIRESQQILTHIGEPPRPPPISPARGPPAWDEAPEPMPDWDLLEQPESDFEFDQRVSW